VSQRKTLAVLEWCHESNLHYARNGVCGGEGLSSIAGHPRFASAGQPTGFRFNQTHFQAGELFCVRIDRSVELDPISARTHRAGSLEKFQPLHDPSMMNKRTCAVATFLLLLAIWPLAPLLAGQDQSSNAAPVQSSRKGIGYLLNYLNMAGTEKATDFRPLTRRERTHLYLKTMVNPLGYVKAATSAGIDQWNDKPQEWEQGASGYGKRFANIVGQYSIQRTVTFGLTCALHEDNRYFNSGKQGFWPRTRYALASGILARHDDGSRHFSVSQVGGVAAGAFLSRLWQPPSQSSAGDGAVSFGITMGSNIGFSVAKEFLPDLGRAIVKKNRKKPSNPPQ
jgi:hypothetical protein